MQEDDERVERLLASVRGGNSRSGPEDERILAAVPERAVPAILEGMKGKDPSLFYYVLRNLEPHLDAGQRERLVSGLLDLVKQDNGVAIQCIADFPDMRARELLRSVAASAKHEWERTAALQSYFRQIASDPAAIAREKQFLIGLADEPSSLGLAAADLLRGFYKDDSYARRLETMRKTPYGSLEKAAAAAKSPKAWEKEKGVNELAYYGISAVPALVDALIDSSAPHRASVILAALLRDQPEHWTPQVANALIAGYRRAGDARFQV